MNEKDLDDIASLWQEAKTKSVVATDVTEIIKAGEARKKSTLTAHLGNASVLTGTVAVLAMYFYYLYDFQDIVSKIGYNLMIGGLVIRILIEFFSAWRSNKIRISDTAAGSLENSIAFHEFRKRIHGPVTVVIFVLYFIGFYMLTPEFSRYIALHWLILMDSSALVVAGALAYFIRRGVRQELVNLQKLIELQRSLQEG